MDNRSAGQEKDKKSEEVLLTWKSPSRLFKKRDLEFYKNIAAIVLLLLVIFIFAREFMLALAVISIVFFVYVTSTVPPEDVQHRITTLGIESAGSFYHWLELTEFWYEEQWGQVKIVLHSPRRGRLFILLGKQDKAKVRELISRYIPFREQPFRTWFDNASSWLSQKVPLEKPS